MTKYNMTVTRSKINGLLNVARSGREDRSNLIHVKTSSKLSKNDVQVK